MRIFIALDIPDEIRARMMEYLEHARSLAPEARWARPEGLHVTLKFIGEAGEAKGEEIKSALAGVKAAPFEVSFANVGFFPAPQAPRGFWIGVPGGEGPPQPAPPIDPVMGKPGPPPRGE